MGGMRSAHGMRVDHDNFGTVDFGSDPESTCCKKLVQLDARVTRLSRLYRSRQPHLETLRYFSRLPPNKFFELPPDLSLVRSCGALLFSLHLHCSRRRQGSQLRHGEIE
jgi:hypothetical protein